MNWLGTDEVGRDVFSRLVYGARPALAVGTLAVLLGGLLGVTLGISAGYYRGPLEASIMRVFDVLFAFPLVLVGVCAVVVLGPASCQSAWRWPSAQRRCSRDWRAPRRWKK